MILDTALQQLETTDMVRRLNDADLAYLIKHALVQDTVRSSLLRQDRKRLHRVVGETLETMYPERRSELASLLAQHFADAGDDEKTLAYLILAGDVATRLSANTEALEHYTRALNLALRMDVPVAQVESLYLKRGRMLEVRNQYDAALELYAEMEQTAAARNAPSLKLAALMATATLRSIPSHLHDAAAALDLSDRSLQLAQQLGNRAAEAKILWNLMLLYSRVDVQYKKAAELGERGLAIARAEGMDEQIAYLLNDLSPNVAFLGDNERAERYNLESRALWRQLGNAPMLTDNLGYAVMNHLTIGDYRQAIEDGEQALQISRETGNGWGEAFSQLWTGIAYWEFGEVSKAIETMENAIELGKVTFPGPLVISKSDLARLYAEFGEPETALLYATGALEAALARFPSMRAWSQSAVALAHLRRKDYLEAAKHVGDATTVPDFGSLSIYEWEKMRVLVEYLLETEQFDLARQTCAGAVASLSKRTIRMHEITFRVLQARIALAFGELDDALATLQTAHALALEKNAQWSLWQVLALMAGVQEKRGQTDAAETLRAQARALVESIAARTPPALRTGLWNRAHTLYEL